MKRKIQPTAQAKRPSSKERKLRVKWQESHTYPVPMPRREPERLAALRSYEVLDTPREECFDQLTQLAARLCGTPIALISLVDADRQWFKARVGLRVQETARSVAFCAHAIMHRKLFVVEDATRDERFADNPLVTGRPGIRFYAGMPLITPEGFALGTLCVIDRQPRKMTEDQQEVLRLLARQAMWLLEMRRQRNEMKRQLEQAQRVVQNLRQELQNIGTTAGPREEQTKEA